MWKSSAALALAAVLWTGPAAQASECRAERFEGEGYVVCSVDMAQADLRLFLNDPATQRPLGSFHGIEAMLAPQGKRLAFAMNAGMYHADRSPVGLYVEGGRELAPLVTRAGPGNFGLLPNGVFCIGESHAEVIEARRFASERPGCRHASQSGPMLVIDGELHPRFIEDSDSRHVRNGVGTSEDGRTVWFAISDAPVNFHSFGRFFRDHLGVRQALYLDGKISRLYAPAIGRADLGLAMGPMVGAVIDAAALPE